MAASFAGSLFLSSFPFGKTFLFLVNGQSSSEYPDPARDGATGSAPGRVVVGRGVVLLVDLTHG